MQVLPTSLSHHRVRGGDVASVVRGRVVFAPAKAMWLAGMASAALIGGALTFSWAAVALFIATTGCVLLLGHSLGSHRKLIHDSFQCPKWLEYVLVWLGVQVGLAGPIGLLRQHELRDYAQRLQPATTTCATGAGSGAMDGGNSVAICSSNRIRVRPSNHGLPTIASIASSRSPGERSSWRRRSSCLLGVDGPFFSGELAHV
jgi:hypothetical protein